MWRWGDQRPSRPVDPDLVGHDFELGRPRPIRRTDKTSNGSDDTRKPLLFLEGSIRSPPFPAIGREEAGTRLREIQEGESLGMPISRPMPTIGPRVHELRSRDEEHNWRIVYRIDPDRILIVAVFPKTTEQTPRRIIEQCKKRLRDYDS